MLFFVVEYNEGKDCIQTHSKVVGNSFHNIQNAILLVLNGI